MTSSSPPERKTCFVIMPLTTSSVYSERFGDPDHFAHVLAHLFAPALEEAGLTAIAPSAIGAEIIHAEIIRNLEQADFVLCDLSQLNPNVLFELGIRTSLDRPVILVKDNLTERVPFDLNAINTHTYDSSLTPWSIASERPRLVSHVKNVAASANPGNSMWRYFGLTKRATPSEAGENSLEAKLDLLISEFSKLQPTINVAGDTLIYQISSDQKIEIFERQLRHLFIELNIDRYALQPYGQPNEDIWKLSIPEEDYQKLTPRHMGQINFLAQSANVRIISESY